MGNSMTNRIHFSDCSPWLLRFFYNFAHCYIPVHFRFQGHRGHDIWVTWFFRSSRICQLKTFLSLQWLDRTWENYISLESAWPAVSDKNKKKRFRPFLTSRPRDPFLTPWAFKVPPTLKFWFVSWEMSYISSKWWCSLCVVYLTRWPRTEVIKEVMTQNENDIFRFRHHILAIWVSTWRSLHIGLCK